MPIMPPTAAQQPSYPSDREALWKAVRALEQRLERPAPPAQAKTGVVTTSRPTVRVLGASVDRDVWRVNSGAVLEVGDEVVCVETALGLVVLSVVQVPPLGPYVPPVTRTLYFRDDFNRTTPPNVETATTPIELRGGLAVEMGNGWTEGLNDSGRIVDGQLHVYANTGYGTIFRSAIPLTYFSMEFTLVTLTAPRTDEYDYRLRTLPTAWSGGPEGGGFISIWDTADLDIRLMYNKSGTGIILTLAGVRHQIAATIAAGDRMRVGRYPDGTVRAHRNGDLLVSVPDAQPVTGNLSITFGGGPVYDDFEIWDESAS